MRGERRGQFGARQRKLRCAILLRVFKKSDFGPLLEGRIVSESSGGSRKLESKAPAHRPARIHGHAEEETGNRSAVWSRSLSRFVSSVCELVSSTSDAQNVEFRRASRCEPLLDKIKVLVEIGDVFLFRGNQLSAGEERFEHDDGLVGDGLGRKAGSGLQTLLAHLRKLNCFFPLAEIEQNIIRADMKVPVISGIKLKDHRFPPNGICLKRVKKVHFHA